MLFFAESDLPNIVIIVADDIGYGDLECYNPDSRIPTPNLNSLSADGIRFTDAHSASTIGIAARYGIMTGRYGYRSGMPSSHPGDFLPALINKDQLTLGSLLQRIGYSTYLAGQWNMGLGWHKRVSKITSFDDMMPISTDDFTAERIDFDDTIEGGPVALGFDQALFTAGISMANSPFALIDGDRLISKPERIISRDSSMTGWEGGIASPDWSHAMVDQIFLDKALEWMDDHIALRDDRPFLLYFAPAAAHLPYSVPEYAKNKSAAGARGDLCWATDHMVGKIVECLKQNGEYDNTLIVFTSDNGPEPEVISNAEAYNHKPAREFRGAKEDIFEAAHRVPLIISWPEKIPAGSVSNEVVCHTDLMATIASITNQPLTYFDAADSYDLSPVILGAKYTFPLREATVHQSAGDVFALRRGKWKVIYGYRHENSISPLTESDTLGMVFNMEVDPQETTNLWPERKKLVGKCEIILDQYLFADRSAPVFSGIPYERVRLKIEE